MSTLHNVGRALRTSIGFAFVAALASSSGCTEAQDTDEPGESDAQSGEDRLSTEEAVEQLMRLLPAGLYQCTLAGGLISGTLVAYPGPWAHTTCAIFAPRLKGSSQRFCSRFRNSDVILCSDCQALRDSFECPYR